MRITIESTGYVVSVKPHENAPDSQAVQCRLWQGESENGVPVCCLIFRVAVNSAHDQSEFERDLQETSAPREEALKIFPLRMVL